MITFVRRAIARSDSGSLMSPIRISVSCKHAGMQHVQLHAPQSMLHAANAQYMLYHRPVHSNTSMHACSLACRVCQQKETSDV